MNALVTWVALLGLFASLGCGDRSKALRGQHHDDESEAKTAAPRSGSKRETDRVITRNPTIYQLLEVCEEMERRGESCLIAEGPDDVHNEALEAEQRRRMEYKLREVREAERKAANDATESSDD
ncbi:MAG: hypothetical protein AAFZ38_10165 [Myxococcota bacterium]